MNQQELKETKADERRTRRRLWNDFYEKERLFDVSSGFQYFSGRARYHVDHGDESGCISIASSPRPRGLK